MSVLPEENMMVKSISNWNTFRFKRNAWCFEENKLRIVADDLAQESRQFRTDVPEGKDALDRLARQWSNIEGCSLAYDPKRLEVQWLQRKLKLKE